MNFEKLKEENRTCENKNMYGYQSLIANEHVKKNLRYLIPTNLFDESSSYPKFGLQNTENLVEKRKESGNPTDQLAKHNHISQKLTQIIGSGKT